MPLARDGEDEAIGDEFLLASAGSDKRTGATVGRLGLDIRNE
jgi:hypothetical protein